MEDEGRRERLFERAAARLEVFGGSAGDRMRWFVPGRIEVFGKHTDYAGGRSLLCAVERGFCLVARPRADRVVRIADAVLGVEGSWILGEDPQTPGDGGWVAYPAAVVRRIARNFRGELTGANIAFASDLPRSAGLSSSSALVVAVFTVLAEINALEKREEFLANIRGPEDLAGYLGAVENGFSFGTLAGDRGVGTFGGSEDHTAILCCRAGHLARYSFLPVRLEKEVAVPRDWTFVVAASGVTAEKAGNARELYNRLSLATREILELWRATTGETQATLGEAARVPGAPERIREILVGSSLSDRFEQFFEESEVLIPAASEAFEKGDVAALGELAARSQAGAENLLRNQVPETVALVASARTLGAIAASAFGGGFGGSVWALVPADRSESFRAGWEKGYRRGFTARAPASEFFATRPGPGRIRV